MFITTALPLSDWIKGIPADGIVTGFGKVNGRYVVAAAEDYLAMAGTFGEQHGKKLSYAVDFAKEKVAFRRHRTIPAVPVYRKA